MKVLIQLTFNNGLGNLYCSITEALNFAYECKLMGHSCEFVFASNYGLDNLYIDYIELEKIFDIESLQVFDKITSIRESIKDQKYNEYYFLNGHNVTEPGQHWWDTFVTDKSIKLPERPNYDVHSLYNQKIFPKILPKFSKEIEDRVSKFKEKILNIKTCIQVRHNDYTLNIDEKFKQYTDSVFEKVSQTSKKIYIASNNEFFLKTLSKLNNVVMYQFDNLNLFPNDNTYYRYYRHVNNEILLNRLLDNICEMIILSEFNVIFHHSSLSWESTFLYYSLSHNKNQKLINISGLDNLKNLVLD